MPVKRLLSLSVVCALVAAFGLASSVAAASSIVDCGQLTGYTAPDPVAPADGSVQLGALTPWTILATATVSPEAAAALPGLVNSGPTCLALDLDDDGNVTSIDFASTGTISGSVTFNSGSGFYLFADRLIVPDFITNTYPGLAALFVTSYQAGTPLSVTFTVDPTSGQFTGVDGTAEFCGPASLTSGGDGQVGDAVIPAAVLDAADVAALEGADGRQACATVRTTGSIQQNGGTIDLTTDVDINVASAPGAAPTPPPTDVAASPPEAPREQEIPAFVILAVIAIVAIGLGAIAQRRQRTR